jgi:Calcium-dependent channel, 7TM region, putative phosphate
MLSIGLFIISIALITPLSLASLLKPLEDALVGVFGETSFISTLLTNYFQTLVLLILNYSIIPLLIDLTAVLEDHKTKSSKQIAIMKKNFFFQLINTIFIPLTGQASI